MALKDVLVAVGKDDEKQLEAIEQTTIDIAGPAGATVHLAHVFTEDEYERSRSKLDFDRDTDVTPDLVAKRQVGVRDVGDALEAADVEFTWHGAVGERADEVVDLAEDIDADLLVVGGRRRSPAGKAVFGSTTQQILLNAPCPVTFVRGD